MSAVHENLQAALSRARPGDTEAHKDIYCELTPQRQVYVLSNIQIWAFIQQNFDELSADSKTVPLYTLTYTIRRILYPQFLLGRIPELLDYLWHVDKYRQRAIEISSQIITWQKFYKNDADSRGRVRLLSAKDEKAIAGFEDKQRVAGSRDAFCECAIRCCRLVNVNFTFLDLNIHLALNSTFITSVVLRKNPTYCLPASGPFSQVSHRMTLTRC